MHFHTVFNDIACPLGDILIQLFMKKLDENYNL